MENQLIIPAASYLRMSTDNQTYSLENQSKKIETYARENGFAIVRTFQDTAKSGLLLRNRVGLRTMLQQVVSHRADFKAILVLDVSRWGRFQDIDESAHYEFLCKQAGIPVHYCSESFSSEITLANMIIKTLKRSMAAEYSRELSEKVSVGSRYIASLGFRNGGVAGYGLRRLMVDDNRRPKQILDSGQRKFTATDRVMLVPGPDNEVQCVREIFRLFLDDNRSTAQIASILNERGIPYLNGKAWYQVGVYRILTHPKYCGTHVFGQRSQRLKGPSVTMPKSSWSLVPNAFPAIVSSETFEKAQRLIHSKTIFKTNDHVLNAMKMLWRKEGKLSQLLVMKSKDIPSTGTYWRRFGGLRKVYELIGYSGRQSSTLITHTRRRMNEIRLSLLNSIVDAFPGQVSSGRKNWRERLRLRLRNNMVITVYVCRPHRIGDGSLRWYLDTARCECCRLSLIARLNETYSGFMDFYLLPCIRRITRLTLKANDRRLLIGVRFTDINNFLSAIKSCLQLGTESHLGISE